MGRLQRFTLFALAPLLACGGRSDRAAPGAAPLAEELARSCADLASATCARREDCAAPTHRNARYATQADCRTRTELACLEWTRLPATALTPEAIASCAETITSAACRDIATLFYSPVSDHPYCLPSGARADGEACVNDAQCQSRHCGGPTCGTCATPSPWLDDYGHEGDACTPEDPCVSHLTCETGTCKLPPCATPGCHDHGHHCTGISDPTDRDCPLGTHCVNQNDMGGGRCEAYVPDGTPCESYAGPPCQHPAACVEGRCTLPSDIVCGG